VPLASIFGDRRSRSDLIFGRFNDAFPVLTSMMAQRAANQFTRQERPIFGHNNNRFAGCSFTKLRSVKNPKELSLVSGKSQKCEIMCVVQTTGCLARLDDGGCPRRFEPQNRDS